MTTPSPNFAPGHEVHHIRARRGLERPQDWTQGTVVAAGDGVIEVRFLDGTTAAYSCTHANEVGELLDTPAADGGLVAFAAEEWGLLGIPLGKPGKPQPTHVATVGVFKLEDGAVTEAPGANPTDRMRLFSIALPGGADAVSETAT